MPSITIAGTIIEFPDTGNSPVWSDSVIQFAQAVETVLSGISNPYDVLPQIYNMVAEVNNNVQLDALQFPASNVRGAFIRYTVARVNSGSSAYEAGTMLVDYNPDLTPGNKWQIQREYVGDALITFSISDAGQMSFSTTALSSPSFQSGQISFTAQSLLLG